MKMDKVANSGNDEFYTPLYAIKPITHYIRPFSKVWCPFDTDDSLFVKFLRKIGCTVIATHISMGTDFFNCDIPDCDYIISTPPILARPRYWSGAFKSENRSQCSSVLSVYSRANGDSRCFGIINLRLCT